MSTKKQIKKVAVVDAQVPVKAYTQEDVPAMIEQLKAQLAKLKGNSNDQISLNISYNGTNISKVTTVKELLEIDSSIQARAAAYNERVKARKLEGRVQEFTVSEKNAEQWDKIIEKAVNELINKTQINQIENAIKELHNHLDANTRLQNKLAELMGSATAPIL